MKSAARWVTSSTDCDLVSLRVLTTGNPESNSGADGALVRRGPASRGARAGAVRGETQFI